MHDVVGVMELDLRRPGYGDSLAQTVAAEGSGPEPAATAPAPAPAAPAASAEGDADCARCRAPWRFRDGSRMGLNSEWVTGLGVNSHGTWGPGVRCWKGK